MVPSEYLIESASRGLSRKLWLLDPSAGAAQRAAIFLDGEFYVQRMDAPALIADLQTRGRIPPTVAVFISHVDGAARHRELTCSADFAAFVVGDVMQWLMARCPGLEPHDHLIGGTSLAGLQAAYIALNYPQVFSRCLSQSGSFWWNDEWLASQVATLPGANTRFWSSVGDQETAVGVSHPPSGLLQKVTQIAACARFAQALSARQHPTFHHVYSGGHEFGPWQAELPDALCWLFSPNGNQPTGV